MQSSTHGASRVGRPNQYAVLKTMAEVGNAAHWISCGSKSARCGTEAKPVVTGSPDDRRRGLLTAAVGFAHLAPRARARVLLHGWLDTWAGVGDIEVGLERQDFDLPAHRSYLRIRQPFLEALHVS